MNLKMHRRDDDDSDSPQPPGICHRLFSLVMAGRLRPVTLGQSELQESNEVTGDCPAGNKLKRKESKSDITIHFKQKEESEANGNLTNKKVGSSGGEAQRETDVPPQVKGNAPSDTKGPKKSVSIMEKGKKSIVTDELTPRQPEVAHPEIEKPKPHRHLRPLPGVTSNINEKTEKFIHRIKEKMKKSHTLEPKS